MSRKLAVAVQELTEAQREKIRAAAERNGFEVRFLRTPDEDTAFLQEAT